MTPLVPLELLLMNEKVVDVLADEVALADLDPFNEWNEAAVIERQNKLTVLARSVWRIQVQADGGFS